MLGENMSVKKAQNVRGASVLFWGGLVGLPEQGVLGAGNGVR